MRNEFIEYRLKIRKLESEAAARKDLPEGVAHELETLRKDLERAISIWKEFEALSSSRENSRREQLRLKALGAIGALRDAYERALTLF